MPDGFQQIVNNLGDVVNGVPTREGEVVGSARDQRMISFSRAGNQTIRKIQVPYSDYKAMVLEALGKSTVEGNDLTRYLPWRDYDHYEQIAVRAEVRPIGYKGQVPRAAEQDAKPMRSSNDYEKAEITIYFETPRYPLGEYDTTAGAGQRGKKPTRETERYAYKEVRPGREYVSAQPGLYVWSDKPAPDNVINFVIPSVETFEDIRVVWTDIPRESYPHRAIDRCSGKTNKYPAYLPKFPPPEKYEAETLFLLSHEVVDVWFPDGTQAINLIYHFRRRPQGYNNVLGPDGKYHPARRKKDDGTADTIGPILAEDYSGLFLPPGAAVFIQQG